jgi:F-type H+-transporting ATPase subunit epsilon
MSEKVRFELVSPAKLLVSRDVDMVVVPGTEGEFGVLPGHSPFIATVKAGVIAIYEGDKIVDRVFVGGGFAEVSDSTCTVLAETAIAVAEIDRAALEQSIQDLREDIADAKDEIGRHKAEAALDIATAKLEAVTGSLAA